MIRPKRHQHITVRIKKWLNLMIGIVVCITVVGFVRLNTLRADIRTALNRVPSSGIGIGAQLIRYYRLPENRNTLEILNEKLERLNLPGSIMDITPESPVSENSTTAFSVRLRLTPVSSNQLADLLNTIEHSEPRFMITSLQLTRLRNADDAVDAVLELMIFDSSDDQTGV
jgi:hypothetical protein